MCLGSRIIRKTIELPPSVLTDRVMENVIENAINLFTNRIDPKEGIIILQIRSVKILPSPMISRDGLINYFTVEMDSECYQPHEGCVLELPITAVFIEGILVRGEMIDFFIPASAMEAEGHRWSDRESWGDDFVPGKTIKFKIKTVRYGSDIINCICVLS